MTYFSNPFRPLSLKNKNSIRFLIESLQLFNFDDFDSFVCIKILIWMNYQRVSYFPSSFMSDWNNKIHDSIKQKALLIKKEIMTKPLSNLKWSSLNISMSLILHCCQAGYLRPCPVVAWHFVKISLWKYIWSDLVLIFVIKQLYNII